MKYHIVTFGCSANVADAERLSGIYTSRGWTEARLLNDADVVIITTCMIRQSAEDRVTGLIRNLTKEKKNGKKIKIILTGCMVGMAVHDTSGIYLKKLRTRFPTVDEFLPIEEIGFEYEQLRQDTHHALVPISRGCNNYCSYCVVPFARGSEVSRPFDEIVNEVKTAAKKGFSHITLVGQNVNSYGSDIVKSNLKSQNSNKKITFVKHLGKMRIPTLFPALLDEVCHIAGLQIIDFISSNPWDFSDELIDVIRKNKNISRSIHLPMQSGSDSVLKRMNRWYTGKEYFQLTETIKKKIPEISFSTDIIVGFPGETEKQFQETITMCKKIFFTKAYISMYSDRPMTVAHKTMGDDIPYKEKKRRWEILDEIINKTNLRKGTYR